ncbi:MAG: aldo/keto reductase [Pseudomonadales bacterium]
MIKRRSFLQSVTALTVGGQAFLRTGNLQAAVEEANQSTASWPAMTYRRLGRTGFSGSRLVFGCGAALSNGKANDLLEPALDAGINVFDVGYRNYYRDAEQNLAPFLKRHREKIFLISKAQVEIDVEPAHEINAGEARQAAKNWTGFLEGSLRELRQDHVDAYYLMATNNVSVVRSEEIYRAFERAREAGKVTYFGISTHENAENVLLAAAHSNWYDLAQIAITPAGWYDWANRSILAGTAEMVSLRPTLEAAREAGIGLIGMKAGRYLAGRRFLGWGKPDAYNDYYDEPLMQSGLTAFQKSYAYVLEHGLDAVNADMQVWLHLQENFVAAATSQQYFVDTIEVASRT